MSADDSQAPSELHELADKVASAAANPTAGYRPGRRAGDLIVSAATHDPREQSRRSARAFWNVTWISAAAIIIALAAVAAAGWIF